MKQRNIESIRCKFYFLDSFKYVSRSWLSNVSVSHYFGLKRVYEPLKYEIVPVV